MKEAGPHKRNQLLLIIMFMNHEYPTKKFIDSHSYSDRQPTDVLNYLQEANMKLCFKTVVAPTLFT